MHGLLSQRKNGGRGADPFIVVARSLLIGDASRFARLALANVDREYPAKLDHVLASAADLAPPRALHPAFFGSFDWHSCVHAHWLLVHALELYPALPEAVSIRATLDVRLSAEAIERELAYLRRPEARGFERTYGWAWLLKLAAALAAWDDADAHRWSASLAPLAQAFADRYREWLRGATYPIRHGMHANSAFGLAFALDYADQCDASLRNPVVLAARRWYLEDRSAPAQWEPSGADFLSPVLVEADLMRRVLAANAFAAWLTRFLPGIKRREPKGLFTPATVSDRSDPQIVHLDGLNLSRAWCWRAIARALPHGDARVAVAMGAADAHLAAGLAGLDSGEYVGEHWLATFAISH
jgi:hypothetical protein